MKLFGIVGWKNTGKTGLMERLVTEITGRGFSVSTIKHAHVSFDIDQPGTDSARHRAAGASEVVLSSPNRVALMQELRGAPEPALADLLERLQPVDLVLVEGFKQARHPKIETRRAVVERGAIAARDPTIRAIASDHETGLDLPHFDLNATVQIADFILGEVGL